MHNSLELQTEKFNTLPEDAQTAIRSFDYDRFLKEIHTSYKLHIDQAYSLEQLVAQVIFGEIDTVDLVSKLESELRITHETAILLGTDINTKILKPIQDSMRKIQSE